METLGVIAFGAFCAAFFAGALVVPSVVAQVASATRGMQTIGSLDEDDSILRSMLRNGIAWLSPVTKRLCRIDPMLMFVTRIEHLLKCEGYDCSVESVSTLLVAANVAALTLGAIFTQNVPGMVVLAVCFDMFVSILVSRWESRREDRFREGLPDVLRSMSVCFHAGLSLPQTFSQLASEAEEPFSSLFEETVHDFEIGKTTAQVLERFQERAAGTELVFIGVALEVQHRAGGSMQKILDSARDSVEGELELKRSLKTKTAQAKLSAQIVSIMPVVLVAVFSLFADGFLTPFFESFLGMTMLVVAIAMQVGGIIMVRKFLNVEVG